MCRPTWQAFCYLESLFLGWVSKALHSKGGKVESEKRNVNVNFRLSQREFDRLERLARLTHRTRSNVIRWLIATAPVDDSNFTMGVNRNDGH